MENEKMDISKIKQLWSESPEFKLICYSAFVGAISVFGTKLVVDSLIEATEITKAITVLYLMIPIAIFSVAISLYAGILKDKNKFQKQRDFLQSTALLFLIFSFINLIPSLSQANNYIEAEQQWKSVHQIMPLMRNKVMLQNEALNVLAMDRKAQEDFLCVKKYNNCKYQGLTDQEVRNTIVELTKKY